MALGRRFGPTLAISLVLFCAAGLTGGHEEHDPNYWNHQAHELLFEKKDYTMQKIVIKSLLYFLCLRVMWKVAVEKLPFITK